ncbi:MAG: hypothetical protein SFX18_15610 [Pirellulales bacterium]|nr:hypothetical protein [Pirellulales bacterium]
MPKILFNITHGFQARMLLRSQIAENLLAAGVELVVVSPNAEEVYFQQEFAHPQITLIKTPLKSSRLENYLTTLRQYFLMNPRLGGTLNAKSETLRRNSPGFYWFSRCVNQVLGNIPPLRRLYLYLEKKLYAGREYDPLLLSARPDLVVTGTPGYSLADIHLIRAAQRAKLRTATVMLSWDNLTSKGYMGAQPDHLLVWSDLMAGEAVEYHDYPRNQIRWCGAAQFDQYFQYKAGFDRAAWLTAQGIPATAKLLMYGTINPGIVPHEFEILRSLVQRINANELGDQCYLWIRLHPQVINGFWAQDCKKYEALAGPRVRIEKPPVRESTLVWDLPKSDMDHLANLLCASDISINCCSTLTIDAACVDTPIINTFFDGETPLADPAKSVARFAHYTHYAKLLETGGVALAHSPAEFITLAQNYLQNPHLHQAERAAIVRQQFNRLDGKAAERTAHCLIELCGGPSGGEGRIQPEMAATTAK